MDKKSKTLTYAVGILLGSGFSVVIATFWLETSPPIFSLLTGAGFSIVGVSMWENIGEAIVLSVITGVLTAIFFLVGPEITLLKEGIIPAFSGFSIGKITVGIAREIAND